MVPHSKCYDKSNEICYVTTRAIIQEHNDYSNNDSMNQKMMVWMGKDLSYPIKHQEDDGYTKSQACKGSIKQ